MKFYVIFFTLFLFGQVICQIDDADDNDFAEFEDFGTDDEIVTTSDGDQWQPQTGAKSDSKRSPSPDGSLKDEPKNHDFVELNEDAEEDGIVEDEIEGDEYEEDDDDEEFEGFGREENNKEGAKAATKGGPEIEIKQADIPSKFTATWDSYWMEMLMIAGLTAYFANYIVGKNKNSKLANMWLSTHKSLLDENFALVGDDGKLENETPGLIKESESLYTLWCSGRTCCEGMLVELRMIKRQDLVALVSSLMRPVQDQIHIKIEISKDSMDTFVFCVASKKTATRLFKETSDLSKYCSLVNKSEEKYNVPSGFAVLSEIPEASSTMLDSRVLAALNKYGNYIDYIHISDQFCGPVQQEDPNNIKQPDVKKMLMAGFNLPKNCNMESVKPLLVLVFYIMERLKRYRLSKESKNKADKNRQRVEEQFLKSTHAARAEAAAQRREEKRKQEKERIMAEDDPEKQRRWEEKEQKRQAKKKAPKMKRLSIKSL